MCLQEGRSHRKCQSGLPVSEQLLLGNPALMLPLLGQSHQPARRLQDEMVPAFLGEATTRDREERQVPLRKQQSFKAPIKVLSLQR